MTITAHKVPTTDFRRGQSSLMTATPGHVAVGIVSLRSLQEMEEFIVALRAAATDAQLPQSKAA